MYESGSDPAAEAADILRAKAGDKSAYGRLVEAYGDRLYAFVLRIVRNTHDAEDIAQRAFIAVWTHFDRFDPSRSFRAWLFGIAYKDSLKLVARRKPVADVTEYLAECDADDPATAAARKESPTWELARRELSPTRYHILRLHYDEELPIAEIATITGCSLVSVKVHLFRARVALREILRNPGVPVSSALTETSLFPP